MCSVHSCGFLLKLKKKQNNNKGITNKAVINTLHTYFSLNLKSYIRIKRNNCKFCIILLLRTHFYFHSAAHTKLYKWWTQIYVKYNEHDFSLACFCRICCSSSSVTRKIIYNIYFLFLFLLCDTELVEAAHRLNLKRNLNKRMNQKNCLRKHTRHTFLNQMNGAYGSLDALETEYLWKESKEPQ